MITLNHFKVFTWLTFDLFLILKSIRLRSIFILFPAFFLNIFILNPRFWNIFIVKIFDIKWTLIAFFIKIFILYNLHNAQVLNLFLVFTVMIDQLLTLIPWLIYIFHLNLNALLNGHFLRLLLSLKSFHCIILKNTVFNFIGLLIFEIIFKIDIYTFSYLRIRDPSLFRFHLR